EDRTIPRGCREQPGVAGLATAGGIKRRTVESDLPGGNAARARSLPDIRHVSCEGAQKRIAVIEPLGHWISLTERCTWRTYAESRRFPRPAHPMWLDHRQNA